MAIKIVKRGASWLAVLALAFGVLVGFQLPAEAASCTGNLNGYKTVRAGSSGKAAKAAQCLLRKNGYGVSADGSFSAADAAKVKSFQRKKNLKATGKVTRGTWKKLVKAAKSGSSSTKSSGSSKSSAKGSSKGRKALAYAKRQLGEPYRFAGAGPNRWDCSGLTMKAWGSVGVKLPHSSSAQIHKGKRVSRKNLRLGDLVYFYSGRSHVGIYAGNGKVIHAPRPGKKVEYSPIRYMPFNGASRPG